MKINIFLLCYNESALLPHTIKHYKTFLPSAIITIYDNESTDNSVEIAKELGCNVISFSSNSILDEYTQTNIRNNCWKSITDGVIIVADTDEYLCISEQELQAEINSGTTILNIVGINMIGESHTEDLTDIDLQSITKYIDDDKLNTESKKLCFLRESITDMNYSYGSHECKPQGTMIKYSVKSYFNKHMTYLGILFFSNKMITRYKRSLKMRENGLVTNYTDDNEKIVQDYTNKLSCCKLLNLPDPITDLINIMNRQADTLELFKNTIKEQSDSFDKFNKLIISNTTIFSDEIKNALKQQKNIYKQEIKYLTKRIKNSSINQENMLFNEVLSLEEKFNATIKEQAVNLEEKFNATVKEQTLDLEEKFNTTLKEVAINLEEKFNTTLKDLAINLEEKFNTTLKERLDGFEEKFNTTIKEQSVTLEEKNNNPQIKDQNEEKNIIAKKSTISNAVPNIYPTNNLSMKFLRRIQ